MGGNGRGGEGREEEGRRETIRSSLQELLHKHGIYSNNRKSRTHYFLSKYFNYFFFSLLNRYDLF